MTFSRWAFDRRISLRLSAALKNLRLLSVSANAKPWSGVVKWMTYTLKEKWSHFDLKSWVTGGTKIRPGIPSNWRIFESIRLKYRKNTIFIVSNWFKYCVELTQYLVNSTQIFSNYSESRVEFLFPPLTQHFRSKWLHFRQWLNFLGQNDSISFSVPTYLSIFFNLLIF